MARASVGYHHGFDDNTWADEGETEYMDVPPITANGFVAQIGFFVGLFSQ